MRRIRFILVPALACSMVACNGDDSEQAGTDGSAEAGQTTMCGEDEVVLSTFDDNDEAEDECAPIPSECTGEDLCGADGCSEPLLALCDAGNGGSCATFDGVTYVSCAG